MPKCAEIALIAAVAERGVIGRANKLLWRIPEDMKYFRAVTKGHPVVMGRSTYESIGRPLPGRRNVVLSRNADYAPDGVEVVGSVEEALSLVAGAERAFVIGGGVVYREFLPYADAMYLTEIAHTWEGDATFPEWEPNEWRLAQERKGVYDIANPYLYVFREYRRAE